MCFCLYTPSEDKPCSLAVVAGVKPLACGLQVSKQFDILTPLHYECGTEASLEAAHEAIIRLSDMCTTSGELPFSATACMVGIPSCTCLCEHLRHDFSWSCRRISLCMFTHFAPTHASDRSLMLYRLGAHLYSWRARSHQRSLDLARSRLVPTILLQGLCTVCSTTVTISSLRSNAH